MRSRISIGTRGSALAIWQAEAVATMLRRANPGVEIEIVRIKTQGDVLKDVAIASLEGKAFFTKEIERALLDGKVDVAVHSGKDLPTELPQGLMLAGFMARHSPADALIVRGGSGTLRDLEPGSTVGTGSIRRKALLANLRPDLKVADLRGNVETRLSKLDSGLYDAIVIAVAGLERLGLTERISEILATDAFPPAVSQGAIALEIREGEVETMEMVGRIVDSRTTSEVAAERALLRALEGGCQVPLGALAKIDGALLRIKASILSRDGSERVDGEEEGDSGDADGVGARLAEQLIERGGDRIVREIRPA